MAEAFSLRGGVHPSLAGMTEAKDQETLYSNDETASLRSWLEEEESCRTAESTCPEEAAYPGEGREPRSPVHGDEDDVLLDLLAENYLTSCAPGERAPAPPKRLQGVTYFGKHVAEWHAASWEIYECKQCNTPIVLKEEASTLSAPRHGDAMEGHCRVCFETSRRKRTKRADYPRKFCRRCAAWVDSTHWQRHLASRGHGDCGAGSDASREVDWTATRKWKQERRCASDEVAGATLQVGPSAVFWASEFVELKVTVSEDMAIGLDSRLVVEVPSASPGFAAARLRTGRGRQLSFHGFNAEFGIFNGLEPDQETVSATVRLEQGQTSSSSKKAPTGELVFYKTPRHPKELVKQRLRLVSRRHLSAQTSLEAQRAWFPLLPEHGDQELEAVAHDVGFAFMRHELVARRLGSLVREIGLPVDASAVLLEFLGCDFDQPRQWAAHKLQSFARAALLARRRDAAATVLSKLASPAIRLFGSKSLEGLLVARRCYDRRRPQDWHEPLARFLVRRSDDQMMRSIPEDAEARARLALACRRYSQRCVNSLVDDKAWAALALLAERGDDLDRDAIFETPGAVPSLARALNRHRDEAAAAGRAVAALAKSRSLKDGLGTQCIPALCATLPDPPAAALVALRDLVKDHAANTNLALEADPCDRLVACLPKLRALAAAVLLSLCGTGDTKPEVNVYAIREFGRAPRVFENLLDLLDTPRDRDLAARALARLCWDDDNKARAVATCLPSLCAAEPRAPHAALALRNIAFSRPDDVLDAGALAVLAPFAADPNRRLVAWAVQAIAHLAASPLVLKHQEHLCLDTLVHHLNAHPAKLVRTEAHRALANLNNHPKLRPLLAHALQLHPKTSSGSSILARFAPKATSLANPSHAKILAALNAKLNK